MRKHAEGVTVRGRCVKNQQRRGFRPGLCLCREHGDLHHLQLIFTFEVEVACSLC
jgi:hypothetical protein